MVVWGSKVGSIHINAVSGYVKGKHTFFLIFFIIFGEYCVARSRELHQMPSGVCPGGGVSGGTQCLSSQDSSASDTGSGCCLM